MVGGRELNEEEQEVIMTLTLDDDTEVEYVVLTVFNAREHEYITLLPVEGAGSEESGVCLYHYSETEDGTPNLDNIEDGDEYEIVTEAFDELLDAQEYNELVGENREE